MDSKLTNFNSFSSLKAPTPSDWKTTSLILNCFSIENGDSQIKCLIETWNNYIQFGLLTEYVISLIKELCQSMEHAVWKPTFVFIQTSDISSCVANCNRRKKNIENTWKTSCDVYAANGIDRSLYACRVNQSFVVLLLFAKLFVLINLLKLQQWKRRRPAFWFFIDK